MIDYLLNKKLNNKLVGVFRVVICIILIEWRQIWIQ